MTLIDDTIRAIRRLQAKGVTCAELSEANLRLLGCRPQAYASVTPQQQAALQLFSRLTAPSPRQAPAASPASSAATVSAQQPSPPSPAPACPPIPSTYSGTDFQGTPAAMPSACPAAQCSPASGAAQTTWDELVQRCSVCQSCPLGSTRRNIVIEDGSRQAELMFIGEGPGEEEDNRGIPFVGRAGQLLNRMIAAMGRRRDKDAPPCEAVYIANIVKCRPPQNRVPLENEAGACLGYLHRQIELVHPKVIVLLGATPLFYLLQKKGIMRLRGQWFEYKGIPVMPTFHPAYVLRFEHSSDQFLNVKRQVWSDLQSVMAKLDALK